jgi:hypothetical protein
VYWGSGQITHQKKLLPKDRFRGVISPEEAVYGELHRLEITILYNLRSALGSLVQRRNIDIPDGANGPAQFFTNNRCEQSASEFFFPSRQAARTVLDRPVEGRRGDLRAPNPNVKFLRMW